MRKTSFVLLTLIVLVGMLLSAPVFAAEQQNQNAEEKETVENEQPGEVESTGGKKKISDIVTQIDGMKEIKPVDVEELSRRVLETGDKSYNLLQRGSGPLLVWGIGISVVMLFFGVVLGKKAVASGITGIIISIITFVFIHFMPETVEAVKNAIYNLFAK